MSASRSRWVLWLGLPALAVAAAIGLIAALNSSDDAPEPAPEPLGPVPRAARWVAPDGSDSNPGTRSEPWRTLERALGSLGAGDTLVLTPGTYGSRGETITLERDGTAEAPVTIRGEEGAPRPRVLGAVQISGSNLRIDHLLFDGPTGSVKPPTSENPRGEQVQVAVIGESSPLTNISISDSEIRGSDWHAGIFVSNAEGVRLVGNHIHHNGDRQDPAQANLSHGIYWYSGSGFVANNVIERNVARGVQLSPEPSGVVVTHNTIVHNGQAGVQLGNQASNNLILNNIVAFNGDRGIRPAFLEGTENRAQGNLEWVNGGRVEEEGSGLTVSDTISAPPLFADRDYRLEPESPAVDRGIEEGQIDLDRDGRRRPRGEASDLGAYESW